MTMFSSSMARPSLRPQFGDEGVQVVLVASRERLAEVQTIHRCSPKLMG